MIENKSSLLSMPFIRRPWGFLLYLFLPAFLIFLVSLQRTFEAQELFFYDKCFQLRPPQKVSSDIAIIEIDDETLQHLGQWPFPRDFHASLVNILGELGAKTIIFDLIFSEPTEYDSTFAESIKKAGQVYLPEVLSISEDLSARKILGYPNSLLAPVTEILDNSVAAKGHINVFVDTDGKIRRVPLFAKDDKGLVPQLGLQAACGYLNLNCLNLKFFEDHVIVDGRLKIPVEDTNEHLVNYPGKWKDSFKHFSYLEILTAYTKWKTNQGEFARLAELKGKACFIGLTATGTADLKASPLENIYPMSGLNASIFNSILEGQFLRRSSRGINIVFAFFIYFFCLFICVKCKPWISFFSSVFFMILWCGLAAVSFIFRGVWIDLFLPLLVVVLVYFVCVSLRWAQDRHQREILEKEMRIAHDIQMQFLLGPKDEHQDSDVAIWFEPAQYVAGDFYDVFHLDGHKTGIVLGDVSGKGLSAALCMAQTISLFRIFSRQQSLPEETLIRLNQELSLRDTQRFVTALYCVIDREKQTAKVASAGQGPLFIYRNKENKIEEISLSLHAPLGVMNDTVYNSDEFTIYSNDKLFLFSDGVSEARDREGNELGIEKIKENILIHAACSNKEILENLTAMVVRYIGQSAVHDDMTAIIFSLKS